MVPALLLGAAVSANAQEVPERESELRAEARTQPRGEPSPRLGGSERPDEAILSGRFELEGSRESAEQQVNEAISRAVEKMSFLTRGFAADRLREKNPIRDSLETEVRGDRIAIRYGDARYETREGEWETVTATGEEVELLQTLSDNTIYQTFRAPDGEKVTVYRFSPDGQRVTLDITVTSPQLPEPLRYSLRYRRAGGDRSVASR